MQREPKPASKCPPIFAVKVGGPGEVYGTDITDINGKQHNCSGRL